MSITTRPLRWLKPALASGAVCLIAGATYVSTVELKSNGPEDRDAQAAATFAASGQSPQQALDATLRGLDPGLFSSASVGLPPANLANLQSKIWINLQADTPASEEDAAVLVWEADLAEGAIAKRIATTQLDLSKVLGGLTIHYKGADPSNDLVTGEGGSGSASDNFTYVSEGLTDDEIKARAVEAIAPYGLLVTNVRVLHPLGPAVEVHMTTSSPEALKASVSDIESSLIGTAPEFNYEGLFAELSTTDGTPVFRVDTDLLSGTGRLWVNPQYADLVPSTHG